MGYAAYLTSAVVTFDLSDQPAWLSFKSGFMPIVGDRGDVDALSGTVGAGCEMTVFDGLAKSHMDRVDKRGRKWFRRQ